MRCHPRVSASTIARARGARAAGQPARRDLERRHAAQAAEQEALAAALHRDRRRGLERLRRRLGRPAGELGDPEMEQRERAQRVALWRGRARPLEQRRRGTAGARQVRGRARPQQHRESADLVVAVADAHQPDLGAGGVAQEQ